MIHTAIDLNVDLVVCEWQYSLLVDLSRPKDLDERDHSLLNVLNEPDQSKTETVSHSYIYCASDVNACLVFSECNTHV